MNRIKEHSTTCAIHRRCRRRCCCFYTATAAPRRSVGIPWRNWVGGWLVTSTIDGWLLYVTVAAFIERKKRKCIIFHTMKPYLHIFCAGQFSFLLAIVYSSSTSCLHPVLGSQQSETVAAEAVHSHILQQRLFHILQRESPPYITPHMHICSSTSPGRLVFSIILQ